MKLFLSLMHCYNVVKPVSMLVQGGGLLNEQGLVSRFFPFPFRFAHRYTPLMTGQRKLCLLPVLKF